MGGESWGELSEFGVSVTVILVLPKGQQLTSQCLLTFSTPTLVTFFQGGLALQLIEQLTLAAQGTQVVRLQSKDMVVHRQGLDGPA